VVGNFDGDAYADLAITVEEQTFGTHTYGGGVHIAYGNPTSIAARGSRLITQDTPGILDDVQDHEHFGDTLAAGDFNGDHFCDLAIGIKYEGGNLFSGGAIAVLYGSSGGIGTAGNQYIDQNSPNVPDNVESGDYFGAALAAGKFDDGAFADLAIGIPGENDCGAVLVLNGSASGLTTTGCVMWTQDSAGILDQCEVGDNFGSALVAGAWNNHTTHDDLAIGIEFRGGGRLLLRRRDRDPRRRRGRSPGRRQPVHPPGHARHAGRRGNQRPLRRNRSRADAPGRADRDGALSSSR
jgi:hypothetical protein